MRANRGTFSWGTTSHGGCHARSPPRPRPCADGHRRPRFSCRRRRPNRAREEFPREGSEAGRRRVEARDRRRRDGVGEQRFARRKPAREWRDGRDHRQRHQPRRSGLHAARWRSGARRAGMEGAREPRRRLHVQGRGGRERPGQDGAHQEGGQRRVHRDRQHQGRARPGSAAAHHRSAAGAGYRRRHAVHDRGRR